MGDHFDAQLPTRLADLAAVDPTPVNPTLFTTIRGRAATQRRRRRGVALVAAAATVLVGIGGGVVVRTAVLAPGPPAATPAAVDDLMHWPVRGDLDLGTGTATLVDEAAAAWDRQGSTGPHRQVRLLLGLRYRTQHIRVVAGTTVAGQVRIAVLVSPPTGDASVAQGANGLQVSLDVAAPAAEPKAIVVTLAGLGSAATDGTPVTYDDGLVVAVLAPGGRHATVRWAPPATGADPVLLAVDPAQGYQTQDTRTAASTARLTPDSSLAGAFSLTTAGDAGQPLGFSRIEPVDGPLPALPYGIPKTALLVPQRPVPSVTR